MFAAAKKRGRSPPAIAVVGLCSLWNPGIERLCVTGIVLLARPTFTREPFLEARPSDLRVVAAKRRNVRLEARFVEPLEHLMELLAQHDAREEERQPAELDRSSHHAAKGRRDGGIGELVASDFDRLANESVRLGEGQSGERPDVVGTDELVWLVGADRVEEHAADERFLDGWDVVVLHEANGPQDGGRQSELTDMVLDGPLRLPMRDVRTPLGAADRRVDEVRNAERPSRRRRRSCLAGSPGSFPSPTSSAR